MQGTRQGHKARAQGTRAQGRAQGNATVQGNGAGQWWRSGGYLTPACQKVLDIPLFCGPSVSTVNRILRRHGLVKARARSRRPVGDVAAALPVGRGRPAKQTAEIVVPSEPKIDRILIWSRSGVGVEGAAWGGRGLGESGRQLNS